MFSYDTSAKEIYIYDEILPDGYGGVSAADIMEALASMPERSEITVRINSPGGVIDEGIAIFNLLRRYKGTVNTVVDSLAASMASYIALAGKKKKIRRNGMYMIHKPLTIAIGNADDMRKTADVLDKYEERMLDEYEAAGTLSREELQLALADESYYTAQEAVDLGFFDELDIEGEEIEPNVAALHKYANRMPDAVAATARKQNFASVARARLTKFDKYKKHDKL